MIVFSLDEIFLILILWFYFKRNGFDLNDFAISQENVSVVGRTGFLLSISVNIYFCYSICY